MIKLIIFDYDGVIVDSFSTIYDIYKIICKKLRKHCPKTISKFKKIYGYNYIECYKNLGIKPENYKKGNKIFKKEIFKRKPKPFEDIQNILEKLHERYILVLISSHYKKDVKQKLKKYNLLNFFSGVFGKEHECLGHFSKYESIIYVINKFKVNMNEVVFIGDRDIDYDEGKKAGLKNIIIVDYGWGYNKKKIKQKVIVKKPSDILKAVRE